jgi:hypothetical protein
MNEQAALAALLRSDLSSFITKSFQTILPGTPYLQNWHIEAIVYQLMRVHRGEISRLLINQPPLAEIDLRVGCLRGMAAGSRPGPPRHRGELLQRVRCRTASPVPYGH